MLKFIGREWQQWEEISKLTVTEDIQAVKVEERSDKWKFFCFGTPVEPLSERREGKNNQGDDTLHS